MLAFLPCGHVTICHTPRWVTKMTTPLQTTGGFRTTVTTVYYYCTSPKKRKLRDLTQQNVLQLIDMLWSNYTRVHFFEFSPPPPSTPFPKNRISADVF